MVYTRPRVLVGKGSKRVDEFANMSDEELRQYVYGKKELDGRPRKRRRQKRSRRHASPNTLPARG